jgi:hypothetical protein
MCNDFLDSYNQSLQVCKVSSTLWTYCIQNTLPKSAKSRFGFLRPLGVKSFLLLCRNKNLSSPPPCLTQCCLLQRGRYLEFMGQGLGLLPGKGDGLGGYRGWGSLPPQLQKGGPRDESPARSGRDPVGSTYGAAPDRGPLPTFWQRSGT